MHTPDHKPASPEDQLRTLAAERDQAVSELTDRWNRHISSIVERFTSPPRPVEDEWAQANYVYSDLGLPLISFEQFVARRAEGAALRAQVFFSKEFLDELSISPESA
jgi:hypothetical protein